MEPSIGARILPTDLLDSIEELQGKDNLKLMIMNVIEKALDARGQIACGNTTENGIYNVSTGRAPTDTHAYVVWELTELAMGENISKLQGRFKSVDFEKADETKAANQYIDTLQSRIAGLEETIRRMEGSRG